MNKTYIRSLWNLLTLLLQTSILRRTILSQCHCEKHEDFFRFFTYFHICFIHLLINILFWLALIKHSLSFFGVKKNKQLPEIWSCLSSALRADSEWYHKRRRGEIDGVREDDRALPSRHPHTSSLQRHTDGPTHAACTSQRWFVSLSRAAPVAPTCLRVAGSCFCPWQLSQVKEAFSSSVIL